MNFIKFKKQLQENFKIMTKDQKYLFEVDVNKSEFWDLYLDSFPEGTNEVYRERREYDCNCCRQFIRDIGSAVVIKDNKISTIWDFETGSEKYQPVVDAMSEFIKSKTVTSVWFTDHAKIGTDNNMELLENDEVKEWNHFFLEVDNKLVDKSGDSEGSYKGKFRSAKDVFKRSLEELATDSIETVLELTAQNSLYKGDEWTKPLEEFLKHKKEFVKLENEVEKNNYAWENSVKVSPVVARLRNHSMGTLLIDISDNVTLDEAVRKYEKIVAPENYKRTSAVFTKRMLEDAQKKVVELGLENSLARRYATLDDIRVNNILFSNKDAARRMEGLDIFDSMMNEVSVQPKNYSRVEEVSIDDFVNNVLPGVNELEVLLENKHAPNMVSLIAPVNQDSKSMFKWDNAFGWAYSGNITDSSMRDNVKKAGGSIDGELRFSIQWNDEEYDGNDLDAHCIEPDGKRIYFGHKRSFSTKGELDIDIVQPRLETAAVENITYARKRDMIVGEYEFSVHCYSNNGGRGGFKAEIEFDGQIFSFEYDRELRQNQSVVVAKVFLSENGNFTIREELDSSVSSRDIWDIKTNQFVPVTVLMNSPNYFDGQVGIGHKHYFFMLKDCVNPEQPNGYYNEFLKQDLNEHRKVFEALGSKMRVQDTEDQLSGLGFSSSKRNDVVVKVKGNIERVLKIKF